MEPCQVVASISLVRMLLLGGDALGRLCSFSVVWGFSSHQSCLVYLLLQQGCLHSPVLKPVLGWSLAGGTQALSVAVLSLCSPQNGVFPLVFYWCDRRHVDGSILPAWKKQVEAMKAFSKKLGSRKVVLVMGSSASARVPNVLTQAG